MDHDQLFKAVLTAQLAPFLELFFPEEASQLELNQVRFVDKELFAAPPMGPGREVDILADVPLRPQHQPHDEAARHTLVAIQIEIQSQREPHFLWRELEYYALLRRMHELPILPIAFFPLEDVLGRKRGRRPRVGVESIVQSDQVLGRNILQFELPAITLRHLDAGAYLAQPQALAGALAARMRPAANTPLSRHKLACLRRIIDGRGAAADQTRQLLADVVETYLPLSGADAEQFERLLQLPENEGVHHTMETWTEKQQEIGKEIGAKLRAQEDVLRVLEARLGPVPAAVAARVRQIDDEATLVGLLVRAATAMSLDEIGLL
ncbi:MAG: DUF4351 domain-containing protein [Ktedonobacterales bacterium]